MDTPLWPRAFGVGSRRHLSAVVGNLERSELAVVVDQNALLLNLDQRPGVGDFVAQSIERLLMVPLVFDYREGFGQGQLRRAQ